MHTFCLQYLGHLFFWIKTALLSFMASQLAQWVKKPPAKLEMQENGFAPWVRKSPGEGHCNPSSILAWRIPRTKEPSGILSKESDITEVTKHARMHTLSFIKQSYKRHFHIHSLFLKVADKVFLWCYVQLEQSVDFSVD